MRKIYKHANKTRLRIPIKNIFLFTMVVDMKFETWFLTIADYRE